MRMKASRLVPVLVILLFVYFSASLCEAKNSRLFDVLDIKVDGKVQLCFKADIDPSEGDEIIILYKKGEYPNFKLFAGGFRVMKTGSGFTHAELFDIQLEGEFVFIDNETGNRGDQSLFLLGTSGVYEISRKTGPKNNYQVEKIIDSQGLLGLPEKGNIFRFDFVQDLNLDGTDEVIIPQKRGLQIWSKKGSGKYEPVSNLTVHPEYFYRSDYGDNPFDRKYSFKGSYWFAQIISRDFNGDGMRDIIFFWEDEMSVFYGSKEGFSDGNRSSFFLRALSEKERDERDTYVVFFLEDLDGNGLPDLIKNKFRGAFTSHVSLTEVTLRNDPRGIGGKTLKWIPDTGLWQGAVAKDINGDGRADLVITSSSFGVLSILKAVLKKRIDIKFDFHHYSESVGYREKADFSRTISVGFDLKTTEMTGVLPTLEGDFNGDGLPDVFYAAENDEARVILNQKNREFSLGDILKQEVEISNSYFFADLDGNSKSDLVFYFKRGENRNIIRVLCNRFD